MKTFALFFVSLLLCSSAAFAESISVGIPFQSNPSGAPIARNRGAIAPYWLDGFGSTDVELTLLHWDESLGQFDYVEEVQFVYNLGDGYGGIYFDVPPVPAGKGYKLSLFTVSAGVGYGIDSEFFNIVDPPELFGVNLDVAAIGNTIKLTGSGFFKYSNAVSIEQVVESSGLPQEPLKGMITVQGLQSDGFQLQFQMPSTLIVDGPYGSEERSLLPGFYQIVVRNNYGDSYSRLMTVVIASVKETSPTTGDVIQKGPMKVTWTSAGVQTATITLYQMQGAWSLVIGKADASAGEFSFNIPSSYPDGKYVVEVGDGHASSVSGVFTIVSPPAPTPTPVPTPTPAPAPTPTVCPSPEGQKEDVVISVLDGSLGLIRTQTNRAGTLFTLKVRDIADGLKGTFTQKDGKTIIGISKGFKRKPMMSLDF